MNIGMIALGSQGDVQPYLALGRALAGAGHHIRLVVPQGYPDPGTPRLELRHVTGDPRSVMDSPEMRALLETGNFMKIQRHANALARQVAPDWARTAFAACQGMDVLLAGLGGLNLAQTVAEALKIPVIEAHVVPLTPTREFPGPLLPPGAPRLGGTFNRLTYVLIRQMMWQGARAGDADSRREVLKLPPAPFFGPRVRHAVPTLYGISPAVLPRPADWPQDVHLTGSWFLDAEAGWTPPPALSAFLAAGPRPVYIGFGSMGSRDPEATADLVLAALERSGQRAVLLSGWGGMARGELPENVFLSGPAPHTWLLPQMAATVHHGGAGTTAAALRAGVPSLVVPFFGDQPYWGGRVQALGVGPAPLPRRSLSVDGLARALDTMSSDTAMQERAERLGAAIRQERGLERAAELIEGYGARLGVA
ncbi:glycosyltransferase [Deinococcus koreensis]|uniref:Glycosyltransferase n=1 Tax=Deinococcus koreensis TaxID=2054903 RepID=A0A2K3UWR4_9DEIO|nr:glycosyltransferase [Deinococcus koreensis]PNY80974.1 glycosyltransferase [Deinococcus koreensis]